MSAYRSSGNRQRAEELGVVAFLEKPFQISKLVEEVDRYFEDRERAQADEAASPSAAVSGDESNNLTHFKLQDLVQLFCLNGRNILITIAPEGIPVAGEIYIQRGRVIHADFQHQTGDDAFFAMMRIENPTLKVKDWHAPVPVSIQLSWERLLLQSAIDVDQHHFPNTSTGRRQNG